MNDSLQLTLDSVLAELDIVAERVDDFALDHGITADDRGEIQLVLEEILTNVIKHGYHNEPGHSIVVTLTIQGGELAVVIEDTAPPFDPLAAPAPDLAQPLEERQPGGLGVFLVKRIMTAGCEYERRDEKNRLTLRKLLSPAT